MAVYSDVANTSVIAVAGLARLQFAVVDADGYPNGPAGALAQGAQRGMGIHTAVKRAGGQSPEPVTVYAKGDDNKFKMGFQFSPEGTGSLDLNFGIYNMDFLAAVTATKIHTLGEWNAVLEETNVDPNTNTLCLLMNITAKEADADSGKPRWVNLFYPLTTIAPRYASHEEVAAADWPYTGTPQLAAKYPWGLAFSTSNNGATRATKARLTSRYPLTMHTLVGNGAVTAMNLDYSPASDDTGFVVKVFRDGVELTKTTDFTVNPGLKKITLNSIPTAGQKVVALYEAFDLVV